MGTLALVLFGMLFAWISLVIVIAIGQGIADLSVPPWPETLCMLAAIVVVAHGLAAILPPDSLFASLLVIVVFWTSMVKCFHIDFFGAIILSALSMVVQWAMLKGLVALLA
jgi:hypothetical protein